MNTAINTIQTAQKEIKAVLKRYRLNWQDVAPDTDEQIWAKIEPTAKKIRQQLFKKTYPRLYAKLKNSKA